MKFHPKSARSPKKWSRSEVIRPPLPGPLVWVSVYITVYVGMCLCVNVCVTMWVCVRRDDLEVHEGHLAVTWLLNKQDVHGDWCNWSIWQHNSNNDLQDTDTISYNHTHSHILDTHSHILESFNKFNNCVSQWTSRDSWYMRSPRFLRRDISRRPWDGKLIFYLFFIFFLGGGGAENSGLVEFSCNQTETLRNEQIRNKPWYEQLN